MTLPPPRFLVLSYGPWQPRATGATPWPAKRNPDHPHTLWPHTGVGDGVGRPEGFSLEEPLTVGRAGNEKDERRLVSEDDGYRGTRGGTGYNRQASFRPATLALGLDSSLGRNQPALPTSIAP